MRPWRMVLPLAGVLMLAAAWSIYWFLAFARAKDDVAEQREKWAARGVSLGCGAESWGGYPFRFEFDCAAPEFLLAGPVPLKIRWQKVQVAAQAYNPFHLVVLADGPGEVTNAGGTVFATEAGRSLASFRISAVSGHDIGVDMPRIMVPDLLKAERLLLNATIREGEMSDLRIGLEQATLRLRGGVDEPVDRFALDASIPAAWLKGHFTTIPATINGAEAVRGSLRLTGHGTIGVDAAHRLEGRIATVVNDIDALLAIVSPHAGMNEKDRAAVKTLLGLVGGTGSGPVARADLIAKTGEVYWGPLRLVQLPPLY